METVIMLPENEEQLRAIKAFAKASKVKFKTEKNYYSADAIAKICQGEEDYKKVKA